MPTAALGRAAGTRFPLYWPEADRKPRNAHYDSLGGFEAVDRCSRAHLDEVLYGKCNDKALEDDLAAPLEDGDEQEEGDLLWELGLDESWLEQEERAKERERRLRGTFALYAHQYPQLFPRLNQDGPAGLTSGIDEESWEQIKALRARGCFPNPSWHPKVHVLPARGKHRRGRRRTPAASPPPQPMAA